MTYLDRILSAEPAVVSVAASTTGRPAPGGLTPEQRKIVEWGDGPLVVIAGAGTGKTRVVVERVRHLLETKGGGTVLPPEPAEIDDPFAGPLVPEQILVLTYNVRAANELNERIQNAIGAIPTARLPVQDFHSFCQWSQELAEDTDRPTGDSKGASERWTMTRATD